VKNIAEVIEPPSRQPSLARRAILGCQHRQPRAVTVNLTPLSIVPNLRHEFEKIIRQVMSNREPVFIGFDVKKTAKPGAYLTNPIIREVCSVSRCFSVNGIEFDQEYRCNAWGFYETVELARELLEAEGKIFSDFDIFAFKLYPVVFDGTNASPVDVTPVHPEFADDFEFLGIDVVSHEVSSATFQCSALSCTGGANSVSVNQYCLFDVPEEAMRFAALVAKEAEEKQTWEPGPYYVCQVYRQKK
jgi:hypothetical protein